MPTTIKRKGFGQVEPNHLSAQRTGQIYAQLIADNSLNIIENGMFLKYDYENRKAVADSTVAGEWLLVYNEEKLYDPRKQGHKYFAMVKTDYVDGEMVPRLFKTNVGDIFTTNCANITGINFETMDTAAAAEVIKAKMASEEGLILSPDANGILSEGSENATMKWQVVKVYTMPDRQLGLKVMRIV